MPVLFPDMDLYGMIGGISGALTILLLLFAVFLVVALLAGALFVTQMMK